MIDKNNEDEVDKGNNEGQGPSVDLEGECSVLLS